MATSVILHEKIKTTLPKAKEIRPIVERLITTAKKGDLNAIRKLNAYLLDKNATQKMITEIAPLYEKRHGGYTRITKIGLRAGDAAEMAYIELLDVEKLTKAVKAKVTQKVKKVEKTKEVKSTKKVAEKKKVAK
jgi:large subunit ribosomal protein L17